MALAMATRSSSPGTICEVVFAVVAYKDDSVVVHDPALISWRRVCDRALHCPAECSSHMSRRRRLKEKGHCRFSLEPALHFPSVLCHPFLLGETGSSLFIGT